MTDHVELIARVFCEHMLKGRKPHADGTPAHVRSWEHGSKAWIGHTKCFFAALAAEGLVIVPREPTEAMIEAGDELMPHARGTETHAISGGRVPEDYYRAMIAAGGDGT